MTRPIRVYDVTGANGEPAFVAGDPRTGALRPRVTRYATAAEVRAAGARERREARS